MTRGDQQFIAGEHLWSHGEIPATGKMGLHIRRVEPMGHGLQRPTVGEDAPPVEMQIATGTERPMLPGLGHNNGDMLTRCV